MKNQRKNNVFCDVGARVWRMVLGGQDAPKTAQDSTNTVQDGAATAQDGAKTGQVGAKTLHDAAKTSQDGAKTGKEPQNAQTLKNQRSKSSRERFRRISRWGARSAGM